MTALEPLAVLGTRQDVELPRSCHGLNWQRGRTKDLGRTPPRARPKVEAKALTRVALLSRLSAVGQGLTNP
jgi:hypothetical protein